MTLSIAFNAGEPPKTTSVLPYISVTAVKRVRDALPIPTVCPYCRGGVELLHNSEVYGRTIGDWPFVYACIGNCEAYVGVHADTDIPLGTLADKQLRTERQKSKQSFHAAMVYKRFSRAEAYRWLASELKLPLGQTHYGWFTLEQTKRAYSITERALANAAEKL